MRGRISSQEEGSHERTPPPRRRGLKAKNEIFAELFGRLS